MFVLRKKGTTTFYCIAGTHEKLNEKIFATYQNRIGLRPKGSLYTMSDFMSDKVVSEVTIRDIAEGGEG